jgi:hypothetical protein
MNGNSLTIGITTFNRRALLETTAAALARVRHLDAARILVLDDCSQEFDVDVLQRLFPTAEVQRCAEHSGGADYAMHRLFERFVRTRSGYLLVLDSDLLPSRNLVDRCARLIEADRLNAQPCLYSVFNTPSHRTVRVDDGFALKQTVGAAGTLWRHGLLADVLRHVPVSRKFDWDWSVYLSRQGVPIRVTRSSLVQHIGRIGQNSRSFVGMDHGEEFDDYRGANLALFLDHTREGLLRMLGEQQARLDNQAKAIAQVSQVVQNQAQLINALIQAASASEASAEASR